MSLSHPLPSSSEQLHAELIAALENHFPLSAVREIVERCPDVLLKKSSHLRCPLFDAVTHGADLDVVQYLVEQEPRCLREEGWGNKWPLHDVLEYGVSRDDVTLYLIDTLPRAVREIDEVGSLPAHRAARRGLSLRVVRALVEPHPQALRARNKYHELPLTLALAYHDSRRRRPTEDGSSAMDVVRYLLDKCPESLGAEDENGKRAFHWAAGAGVPPEAISYLLELRPEALREATHAGVLPVHCAAGSSSPSGFASFRLLVDLWPESIRLRTGDDNLPLHIALSSHHSIDDDAQLNDRLRYILDRCPEAIRSKAGYYGQIPLHHAILVGAPNDAMGLLLYEWPESIHELAKDGESTLHVVSQSEFQSLDMVRFLVGRDDRIVDARSAGDGSLPVHNFASGHAVAANWDETELKTVRFLVERRPESVLARDDEGCLPIHRAFDAPQQFFEVVEYLVGQRPETLAEKNHKGSLPLHIAVKKAPYTMEKVRFLVEQRPESLREGDNEGNLPIHIAVSLKFWEPYLVGYLAEQDPDSLLVRNNEGLSPLHLVLVTASEIPLVEAATILVEQQPDVVAVGNDDGLLPLHVAAAGRGDSCPDSELVEFLLGARPDTALTPARDGRLPLHCACAAAAASSSTSESALEVVWCLVEHRPEAAMVATLNAGRLPLHCALAGARLSSAVGDEHETQLLLLSLVQLLVDAAPASLRVRDGRGLIPLQVAAANPWTPLDVLWLLMTAWPAAVSTLRPRPAAEGQAALSPAMVAGSSLRPSSPKRPRRPAA